MAETAQDGRVQARHACLSEFASSRADSERHGLNQHVAQCGAVHQCIGSEEFVYELMLRDRLMYIGRTLMPDKRIRQHRVCREMPTIEFGDVILCCCEVSAHELERLAIATLQPEWNKTHMGPRPKKGQAPFEQAWDIWTSAHADESNLEVAERIPGWSAFMCHYWFGTRSGRHSVVRAPLFKAAGVSVATMYRHFGDRYAIKDGG